MPENHQHLTGRYIQNYLHFLNEKLNQYNVDLQENRRSRPHSMSVNTEKLDLRLYNYVRLHHLNLLRLSQYQLNRFKNDIQENRLLQQLEKYSFTNEQVRRQERLSMSWYES